MSKKYELIAASEYLQGAEINLLKQAVSGLAELFVTTFPGSQKDVAELMGKVQSTSAQNHAQAQAMVLKGHGPNGVKLSGEITTSAEHKAFLEKLPKVAAEPIDPSAIENALTSLFGVHRPEDGRLSSGWVLPTKETHGAIVKDVDLEKDTGLDVTSCENTIRLLYNQEQQPAGFVLVLVIDETTRLLFDTTKGLELMTYSALEESWVMHSSWEYLSAEAFNKALRSAAAGFNITSAEATLTKQLGEVFKKIHTSGAAFESPHLQVGELETVYKVSPLHHIVYEAASGEVTARSFREDLPWDRLPLLTRWQVAVNIRALVGNDQPAAAPTATKPVAKAVKKAAKKATNKR